MFYQFMGLFLLVIAASARHIRMKKQGSGWKLPYENLTRHSRAENVELAMEKEIHRVADPPSTAAPITLNTGPITDYWRKVTKMLIAVPSNHRHGSWTDETWCPGHSYAVGYQEFHDGDLWDDHGLTQLKMLCQVPYYEKEGECDDESCRWIKAGLPGYGSTDLGAKTCPHKRQFLTGVQVLFGGKHYGAWKVRGICDVPKWESTPEAIAGEDKPARVILRDPNDDIPWGTEAPEPTRAVTQSALGGAANGNSNRGRSKKTKRLEVGPELLCKAGSAICNVNTRNDEAGAFEQDSGITGLMFECCEIASWARPSPSPSPSTSPSP